MGFISKEGLKSLESYSYSGIDHSIIANYVLKHFWNWLLDFIPTWVAPNVLTLAGLFSVFASYFVFVPYADNPEQTPWSTYVLSAFFIFAYQTLDNLDGKQARKTGSSSPLGECFDHGCDSLTVPMFCIVMGLTTRLGPFMMFVQCQLMMLMFYLAHFEAYFTRKLILRAVNNPTEAQLLMCSILLVTAMFGSDFWLTSINFGVGVIQVNHLLAGLSFLGTISTCLDFVYGVYKHFVTLQISFKATLPFFAPFSLLMMASCSWVVIAPDVLYNQPKQFMFTIGWIASYLTIRLVVQSVCKEPYLVYYPILSPLLACVANAFLGEFLFSRPIVSNDTAVMLLFVYVVGNVLYMSKSVVSEFCNYLSISAFSIRPTTLPV
eukprot:TRINITY_DN23244_c0_g1_i1.p1 TRINITY_DN23244_c0_g1~~TRINITY_DN23244_c0_g1_i1.p1  ORF type:complete len:378 (+),score=-37.77 TRINITY_DN23244_c0_g1_i1:117-1250(+)